MKSLFLFVAGLLITCTVAAQLKATPLCPEFVVNIMEGNISGMQPNSTQGQVEKLFPCFSDKETETDSSKCGGLLKYADKDICFYTGRDYIEIGEKFKGKMSIPLMGAPRSELFKWLGYPKIKDVKWDAFQTAYGLLITYYNDANKVNMVRMSTKSAETIKLCE